MPVHLFITCGTSQLGDRVRALDQIQAIDADSYRQFYKSPPMIKSRITTDFLTHFPDSVVSKDSENEIPFYTFAEALKKCTTDPEKNNAWVGMLDNPMGSELSTLTKIRHDGKWNPAEDKITLLVSETLLGVWCAAMLREVLFSWGVPKSHLRQWIVEDLSRKSDNPEKALFNLSNLIVENYDENDESILVMTGGFKSSIPVLTLVGLVCGMKLVYIFEEATDLQWIDLSYKRKSILAKLIKAFRGPMFDQMGLSRFVSHIISTWAESNPPDPMQ